MKNTIKVEIPTLKFNSDYFHCPICGWEYPGPLLIKGDFAPTTKCKDHGDYIEVNIDANNPKDHISFNIYYDESGRITKVVPHK